MLGDLSFKLLALLAEIAPNTVSFEKIERDVWGTGVTRETLKQRVKLLREELRELGVPDTAVEAVRNTGYRLTIAVAVREKPRTLALPYIAGIAAILPGTLIWACGAGTATDNRLTIAVVTETPQSDSFQAEQRAVRDGLVRDLSRLDEIAVLDPSIRASSKGDLVTTIAMYPRRQGHLLSVKLADAPTGYVLWAESYAFDAARVDQTVQHAANNIHANAVALGSTLGAGGYPAQSSDIQRSYMQSLRLWRSGEKSGLLDAQGGLRAILREEPDFLLATSLLARVNADLVLGYSYPQALATTSEQGLDRLLDKHPHFADFRYSMARVQLALGRRSKALAELRRAEPAMPFLARDIRALEGQMSATNQNR